jgi:hypothetical protein
MKDRQISTGVRPRLPIRRFLMLTLFGLSIWVAGALILPPWALAQRATGAIVDDASLLDPGELMRITNGDLLQIAFSPDETILAVATSAGLWLYAPSDAGNGELLIEEPVQALWWSADSTQLAATLADGSLQLWQMVDRELLGTVDGAAGAIITVAWSPDGNEIATGSADGVIEIWSVSEGVVLETLEGHRGSIVDLYWIADGSQIVSAADDGSVRVWGVEVAAPPTPTPTLAPTAIPILATVQVDRLNVRNGPGTNFERIATGLRGEALVVLDQEDGCAWLQVRTPDGVEGWVAGAEQFVTLAAPCASIGQVAPAVTPAATATSGAALPLPTATPQAPAVTPTATVTPIQAAEGVAADSAPASSTETPVDPFPPDQGCYLFQNGLPVPLTLEVTAAEGIFSQTIQLAANEEAPFCFEPGAYRYTLRYQVNTETPPAEIPGEFVVNAGERFLFPIRPQ